MYVAAGGNHTVGVKSDGNVVAVGWNDYDQCDINHWTDIMQVAAGGNHTVGLKKDGSAVVSGYCDTGQSDVDDSNLGSSDVDNKTESKVIPWLPLLLFGE